MDGVVGGCDDRESPCACGVAGLRDRIVNLARTGALALLLIGTLALHGQNASGPLPVLRTAHAAHILSNSEAERHYPVQLDRAQITFIVAGYAFLEDGTDGIFALTAPMTEVPRAGDLVRVTGVTASGDLLAIIDGGTIQGSGSCAVAFCASGEHGSSDDRSLGLETDHAGRHCPIADADCRGGQEVVR